MSMNGWGGFLMNLATMKFSMSMSEETRFNAAMNIKNNIFIVLTYKKRQTKMFEQSLSLFAYHKW